MKKHIITSLNKTLCNKENFNIYIHKWDTRSYFLTLSEYNVNEYCKECINRLKRTLDNNSSIKLSV